MRRSINGVFICALAGLASSPVSAATYRVGTGPSCSDATLQGAIDRASGNPGLDVIRVSKGVADSGQALRITGHSVSIIGGFESCNDRSDSPGLEQTLISGLGGARAPVFEIRGPGEFALLNLDIRDGDPVAGADGDSKLVLAETHLRANTARDGGGMHVVATAAGARVELGEGAAFFENNATRNGGGVSLAGPADLRAYAHRLFFHRNAAAGVGGGLHVAAPARADIASAVWDGYATFLGNGAFSGGAVAVQSERSGDFGTVRLYSLYGGSPMRIERNYASQGGTAFFARGEPGAPRPTAVICTRLIEVLNHGRTDDPDPDRVATPASLAEIRDAELGKCSIQGRFDPVFEATACVAGAPCNRWHDNHAGAIFGNPRPLIDVYGASLLELSDMRIERNVWRQSLISAYNDSGRPSTISLSNSAVTANPSNEAPTVFQLFADVDLRVRNSTVAGNASAADGRLFDVYVRNGVHPVLDVKQSILFAPASATRFALLDSGYDVGRFTVTETLVRTPPNFLAPSPDLIAADPRFVSATDFHLKPGSPAIDFARNDGSANFDLDGAPRGVDDPTVVNR